MTNEKYLDVKYKANELRRQWNINEYVPIDLITISLNKMPNLTIVFYDMPSYMSGSSYNIENEKIIFINSNHSLGRQRFTLAHEIYHLLFEKEFINCTLKNDDENELLADEFAISLLMSDGALFNYERDHNIKKWLLEDIIKCEQYFQISHKALLRKLFSLKRITSNQYNDYLPNIIFHANKNGYDSKLYVPYSSRNLVIGNYIKLTNDAFENELISKSKKDKLLNDAFYYYEQDNEIMEG